MKARARDLFEAKRRNFYGHHRPHQHDGGGGADTKHLSDMRRRSAAAPSAPTSRSLTDRSAQRLLAQRMRFKAVAAGARPASGAADTTRAAAEQEDGEMAQKETEGDDAAAKEEEEEEEEEVVLPQRPERVMKR